MYRARHLGLIRLPTAQRGKEPCALAREFATGSMETALFCSGARHISVPPSHAQSPRLAQTLYPADGPESPSATQEDRRQEGRRAENVDVRLIKTTGPEWIDTTSATQRDTSHLSDTAVTGDEGSRKAIEPPGHPTAQRQCASSWQGTPGWMSRETPPTGCSV